jgi:Peptidase family M23/PEP-CTERM motif
VAAWLACAAFDVSAAAFVLPLGGEAYRDWTIVNYVDAMPGPGVADYQGGSYSYDGHVGIDFTLPNFAAMDRGIPVYAAAAGTVISVLDGQFDRCSSATPCSSGANIIVIDHGNGIATEYWHLANGSPRVTPGQAVQAGEQIANVGSSGLSSDPHLHFVVAENGLVVDTFADPARWWAETLPYAGSQLGVLDFGVTYRNPTDLDRVNRPAAPGSFTAGVDETVFAWVNIFGTKSGDLLDFVWYTPGGERYGNAAWAAPEMHFGWWVAAFNLPAESDVGSWTIAVQVNGQVLATSDFTVGAVPEPATYASMLAGLLALVCLRRRRAGH